MRQLHEAHVPKYHWWTSLALWGLLLFLLLVGVFIFGQLSVHIVGLMWLGVVVLELVAVAADSVISSRRAEGHSDSGGAAGAA